MSERTCARCGAGVKAESKFCPSCGSPSPSASPPSASSVRRATMGRGAKRGYALAAAALLLVFVAIFIGHLPGKPHPVIESQPSIAMATMYTGQTINQTEIAAAVSGGTISIPLTEVLQHKIVAFEYRAERTVIPLLAYISAEGKLVTSIRMCEPCNSKTFRIEGTELACGNCETRWKLDNLEGLQGACQKYAPEPVPSRVEGGEIRIDEDAVRRWKMRI